MMRTFLSIALVSAAGVSLAAAQATPLQPGAAAQAPKPPAPQKQQPLYAEVPYRISAEGTYHNLGMFFDRVSKFPRIINVGDIAIRAASQPQPNQTITAECTATTFVLQEGAKGGRGVPAAAAR